MIPETPPIAGWFAQPAVTVVPPVTLPTLPTTTPSGKTSLTPLQIAAAYQIPAGDGAGVTIGVIALAGELSIGVFDAYCSLLGVTPPPITSVSVNSATPESDGTDATISLSVGIIGVLVPKASIRIYYTPDSSNASYLAAVTQALAECDLVSSSYMTADTNVSLPTAQSFELALRQARTRGVSYFNSSGDISPSAPTALGFPVNCPSTISVGATAPTITGGVVTAETGMSLSGGGPSRVFPYVSAPVVACFGDFTQGYPVALSDATWGNYSSTLGAAPFMAAVHARLIQKYGKRFDFQDFALGNTQAFNDMTSGSNGTYVATTGRDMVTGIGSPKGSALLAALAGYQPTIIVDGSGA